MSRAVLAILALLVLAQPVVAKPKEPTPDPIPRDEETGRYQYQEVVEVNGVDAATLHDRARAWVVGAYRSANDVIQLDDTNNGRLVVKGLDKIPFMMATVVIRHTLTIEAKDGRYRYTMTDFIVTSPTGSYERALEDWKGPGTKKGRQRIAASSENLLASLRVSMEQPSPVGDDEW